MDVTLLYFDGCPNWEATDQHLRALADEFDLQISYRKIESPEEADEVDFRGSPTVLLDGHDPLATGDELVGLSCRIYQTAGGPAGSPTIKQLRAALDSRPA